MILSPLDQAKRIASEGLSFHVPAERGLFPPRDVANDFFACGVDDLPGDGEGVLSWRPFELTEADYDALLAWWRETHPGARVDRLGIPGPKFSRWFSAAADVDPAS